MGIWMGISGHGKLCCERGTKVTALRLSCHLAVCEKSDRQERNDNIKVANYRVPLMLAINASKHVMPTLRCVKKRRLPIAFLAPHSLAPSIY